MKNGKAAWIAVLLGVVLAATSFASGAKLMHVVGKISLVDASAMSLTVAGANGKSEKIDWTAATAVVDAGKNVASSALAAGAQVKVVYEDQGGKKVATRIEILKAESPASATKPK